ncbi:hypothetical protein CACET_c15560 [Clostridium aceticum]|uniref:Uncharacterized protein n=1 Tax=Clostridium aceticum TaxID=84022 RepID=A0A0D8IFE2_9CLOT|nr:DUF6148 family protein [Clostridium aceticum]AKL95005.1 hypothetical protein CACET_c15560 [Clostridium aceticum]KJF27906.1 hypothetical protein TZ02_04835 [Clostridium aceticum]
MAAWTLEIAKKHLNAWLKAELAVSTGQSYKIGSRQLTRANLSEIKGQIKFWRTEVEKLKPNSKGPRRVMRIVPRDL